MSTDEQLPQDLALTTQVVIVGAGPTGLTAAVRLAESGVQLMIVDAAAHATTESRAALVHASTIEILQRLGIGADLVAAGQRIDSIVLADGQRSLARIRLDRLPSEFPFAIGVPQSVTEDLLAARLAALGHRVHRNVHVVDVTERSGRYVVSGTDGSTGRPFAVTCQFVVGADGSRSVVRGSIGQPFSGDAYADDFVLADVELAPAPCPPNQARITLSPHGVTVLGMLPSGRYRVIATATEGRSTPPRPDREYMSRLLAERAVGTSAAADPAWSSRFRISHRVAEHFRSGGVFLCGDAAHVHSPAAGQGMNTGIADAYDLAERLAAVIEDGRMSPLLDGYEPQRRAAAREVLRYTDRITRMALLKNPVARAVRNAALRVVTRIPVVQRTATMWISGLKRSPLRC